MAFTLGRFHTKPKLLFYEMSLKIMLIKLLPHLPGSNEWMNEIGAVALNIWYTFSWTNDDQFPGSWIDQHHSEAETK